MYKDYFRFNSLPFSNTPDPDRFFMGAHYRESLALMIHGVVSRKGLICITGQVGSGKTTLAAVLVRHISENSIVIKLPHPIISPKDMILFLAKQLKVEEIPKSPLQCIEIIQSKLIKINDNGKHVVLIIDEAHLISIALFREILILSNLETVQHKLIQIVLIGQSELLKILGSHELRQLAQRIAVNKILKPMNQRQTVQYIRYRLKAAGGSAEAFTEEAFELIADYSDGFPRIINKLCDAALLDAFILLKKTILL